MRDFRSASISAADRAMLEYAVKLTEAPHSVGREDARALGEAGFEDAEVLDVCQVTSYYNYVNRLADGLGVELEDYWTVEDLTITPEEFRARRADRSSEERG